MINDELQLMEGAVTKGQHNFQPCVDEIVNALFSLCSDDENLDKELQKAKDNQDKYRNCISINTLIDILDNYKIRLSQTKTAEEAAKTYFEIDSLKEIAAKTMSLYSGEDAAEINKMLTESIMQRAAEEKSVRGKIEAGDIIIEYRSQPNFISSGDKVYVEKLGERKYAVLVLDAAGHDHAAEESALRVVEVYKTLDDKVKRSCSHTLEELNNKSFKKGQDMITAHYMIIDTENNELRYSVAGTRLLFDDNNDVGGIPMNIFRDAAYTEKVMELEKGDYVIALTDGFEEQRNPKKKMFGKERVKEVLARNDPADPTQMIDALFRKNEKYRGGFKVDDDRTAVMIYRKK